MSDIPSNNDKNSYEEERLNNSRKLVNKIFRKIKDNKAIPESVQSIIKNLQPPVMKIALATPNLFAFDSHYARVFIEAVCRTSIEWLGIKDTNNVYLKKLENIVNSICENEKYLNKDFINYQNELEKTLIKLKKRAAIRKKREEEKLLGQKKINEAKQETAKIITNKLKSLTTSSEFIEHILEDEWSSVLDLLHIRNGQNSEVYQSNVQFVDMLINLTSNPVSLGKEREKYRSLFKIYQKGLSLVAFNKQEIKERRRKLLDYFNTMNKSNHTKDNKQDLLSDKTLESITLTEKDKKKVKINTVELKKSHQQNSDETQKDENIDNLQNIESFKIGSWFEIQDANGQFIKAKLSWISPITEKHLFVDSQGLKLTDKTKSQLVEGIKNKTIKEIRA